MEAFTYPTSLLGGFCSVAETALARDMGYESSTLVLTTAPAPISFLTLNPPLMSCNVWLGVLYFRFLFVKTIFIVSKVIKRGSALLKDKNVAGVMESVFWARIIEAIFFFSLWVKSVAL